MADSSRPDGSRARAPAGDLDRDEKIEHLLLAGLDHYFAARYEHAVNVWTRVLFLDRGHARAHAYIERGRTALAERQRRSEELLQDGVTALNRGHGYEARRLLNAAVEQGAPPDDVHPWLDRLDRDSAELVDAMSAARVRPAARLKAALRVGPKVEEARPVVPAHRTTWALALAGIVAVLVAYESLLGRDPVARGSRLFSPREVPATSTLPSPTELVLPLPRRGELALDRARGLALRGRLHEALSALDQVHVTDPEQPDADRLRAEWQRQLLGLPDGAAAPESEAPRSIGHAADHGTGGDVR